MKRSLKQRIKDYLDKRGEFVNGGEIERLAMAHGYKASNASRRLRELYEDELVERDDRRDKKRTVWYRSLSPKKKVAYRNPETGEVLAVVYQ